MRAPVYHIVSLGCPKNTVDSQRILGAFALDGWTYAEDPARADLCLVNTCGFLHDSRVEAADTLAALRRAAPRAKLVALGCLPERVGSDLSLAPFLADADACAGFADYHRLPARCRELLASAAKGGGGGAATFQSPAGYRDAVLPSSYMRWLSGPALRYTPGPAAWLKLGEGCSNHCAYCAIPLIRGDRVSRPVAAIAKNARQLLADGARELNLVAQDTTAYGMDFDGKPHLLDLLHALLDIDDPFFIRLLYAHPRHISAPVLRLLADEPRLCPYLDLPIQHSETRTLRAMNRGYGAARVRDLVHSIRDLCPDIALRTTLIVGHPGESPDEFDRLLAFVLEGHFDHLGVFAWSPEPGTPAEKKAATAAAPAEALRRQKLVMDAQKAVSAARWKARRRTQTVVFPDTPNPDGTWSCHSLHQAPDGLDGTCTLHIPDALSDAFDPALPALATIVRTSAYSIHATLSPAD